MPARSPLEQPVAARRRPRARLRALAGMALLGALAAASCTRTGETEQQAALLAAIADVEAGRRTTPLIAADPGGGEAIVTFLAESPDGRAPRIVSDVTGWGENAADNTFDMTVGTMTRVGATRWWALATRVAPGARIEYLIVLGSDYRLDPHNPRRTEMPPDPVSEFVTPPWTPPAALAEAPPVPAGRLTPGTLASRALGVPRRLVVYTPPGYERGRAYPLAVVVHNSLPLTAQGRAPLVLDRLIAARSIEPLVAVFVGSHEPGDPTIAAGAPLNALLSGEVPAWVEARFSVSPRPADRAIIGISCTARDAVEAAVAPDSAYGRLGLLIPGRRLHPADLAACAVRRGPPLRVAILAGRYDAANIETAGNAARTLAAAGHAVRLTEVPEGHTPVTWRNHLADVLVALFGE